MARDHLDHLRLTRLETESVFRPRSGFASRPRLRADSLGHGDILLKEAEEAARVTSRRRPSGVSPDRLMILRMRFLDEAQRELLERFGVVVDEREERQPVEPPYYELLVEFDATWQRDFFRSLWRAGTWGVQAVEDVRASTGGVDDSRFTLRFADLGAAQSFQAEGCAGCKVPHMVLGKEKRVSVTVTSILTVQFLDHAALDTFLSELRARRANDDSNLTLTAIQRAALFDALDRIEQRGPDERRGDRLRESGPPEAESFALDVDLWHPGSGLLREAEAQFREVVAASGGRVTGTVRPVMQTLLISRVRGGRATLDALLNYDRVARVDLPPVLEPVRFALSNAIPTRAEAVLIPADGPLACVVDSGVASGHPLLRGLVAEQEDFQSGEEGAADLVGHGTHVAGVVVYGDIWTLLRTDLPWVPQVRVVSAKVLRRVEEGFDGEYVRPGFSDLERAEGQIEDAIRHFASDPDRKCRVFNLSLGNPALCLNRGHQLPWALKLDELARELDVVIVVSAGNVSPPAVPAALNEAEFRAAVREQLYSDAHALIDPVCAATALTVGAVSRLEAITASPGEERADLVGSPAGCPAPFTRTGSLAANGVGPARAVKPELVAFGGNLSLLPDGVDAWRHNHPELTEPSLNHDFTNRWLTAGIGTSVAAPYVTHVCSLVEERMRRLLARPPSANLIRALTVNSARVDPAAEAWLGGEWTEAQAVRRRLRAVGYGVPDPYRACHSDNHRAVLFAEDAISERRFHLYTFVLPQAFVDNKGVRLIRVTAAHDPPVRGTRLEYISRSVTVQLYRGVTTDQIRSALADAEGDAGAVKLPDRAARFEPQLYEWSTVQSLEYRSSARTGFVSPKDDDDVRDVWHVLVGCKPRFTTEQSEFAQRYALVVSIEHADETVEVYQPLRAQVEERVRLRTRT